MGEEGSQKVDQEEPVPSGEEKGKVVGEKAGEEQGKTEEEKAGEQKGKGEEEEAGEEKGKVEEEKPGEDLAAERVVNPSPRQKSFPEVDEKEFLIFAPFKAVDAGTNSTENQRLAKKATQEGSNIRTPLVARFAEPEVVKSTAVPLDRDAVLAQVANEKRLALIKAWEESEKTKADNKAHKRYSTVDAWENSRKAAVDLELKKIEENFDKKKAEYAEKMKNKVAELHKAAEEKRATIEANRREEIHKVDQTASNFRTSGSVPKRLFGCFGL